MLKKSLLLKQPKYCSMSASSSPPPESQDRLKEAAKALREKLLMTSSETGSVSSPPHTARDFVRDDDPRFKQHRCFPRLSDSMHAATDFSLPIGAFFARSSVMMSCFLSKEGEEPQEPAFLRPQDDYRLRYRNGRERGASG